jgi:rod shape-determining protein MreD
MALIARRTEFSPPPGSFMQQAVPAVTVMFASMIVAVIPYVATAPVIPPLGFMMLLAWRLLRSDIWPVWGALPLGLFDDLFSGAPIGTAMALWTITFIAIDMIDRRFVWRDHWQDWAIATAAITAFLLMSLAFENFAGGGTPIILLLPQIVVSILVFPVLSRIAAMFDRMRLGR